MYSAAGTCVCLLLRRCWIRVMLQIRDGLKYFGFWCWFLGNFACVDIVLVGVFGANIQRTNELVEL